MNSESDTKRMILAMAITTEVEAMKIMNIERIHSGRSPAYGEVEFWNRAEQLRNLAAVHPDEL